MSAPDAPLFSSEPDPEFLAAAHIDTPKATVPTDRPDSALASELFG